MLQKNKRTTGNKILSYILLVLLGMGIYYFTQQIFRFAGPSIVRSAENGSTILRLKDSIQILKQTVNFYESRKGLVSDSLLKIVVKASGINPIAVVQWHTVYRGNEKNVQLQDSLSGLLAEVLMSQDQLKRLTDSERIKYEKDKVDLYAKRIKFRDSTKYLVTEGDFGIDGKINIKSDVFSEPYVIFGDETPVLGIGKTKYSVLVGDKNTNSKPINATNSFYYPPQKLELGIGPIIMGSPKQISTGIGLTFKKGIFTGTFGYQLTNNKFK